MDDPLVANKAMNQISPELVSAIDVFLFQTKNNRAKIFIVGEIIPMLSSVKIFLMRFLKNA
jgi:hypothetical protein